MAYLGVRANAVSTPNKASSTARVLIIVSPTPTAINIGSISTERFQFLGYNSRCAIT